MSIQFLEFNIFIDSFIEFIITDNSNFGGGGVMNGYLDT